MLTSADFIKKIKNDAQGSFLFFGDEDYLKLHALRSFKDAMGIESALEIFNFISIDVLDYSSEKLIDALTIPPMMAEKKLVALTGIDPSKLSADELNDLLNAIAHVNEYDYNNLVFIAPVGSVSETNSSKTRKEFSAFSKLSSVLTPVKFDRSTDQKLISWAIKHFAHYGISAKPSDCAFLLEYCGKSMFVLANEIEKLSYYIISKDRKELYHDDILNVCCAEMEYGTWDFANAIMANRKSDALSILSVMKFKQIDPIMIMGELTGILSNLISVKVIMLSGGTHSDVVKKLKWNDKRALLHIKAVQGISVERLKALSAMCCEADEEIKLSYKGYSSLEKLICKM